MRLHQALGYFCREAAGNLLRSWKISLLAVATIAVSLFLGGAFFLFGDNLSRLVGRWQAEVAVVVYLAPDAQQDQVADLRRLAEGAPWAESVKAQTPAEAAASFRATFPSLAGLLEGWEEEPLPGSLEIAFDPERAESAEFAAWVAALRDHPAASLVDDDRDWLRQLTTVVALARGVGATLGLVLLGAAVFTIGSVIRLTAYLYQDEIAVLRLVGATEFYIRGPFYAEGLIQGLLGGLLAVGGLAAAFAALARKTQATLVGELIAPAATDWKLLAGLVVLGGLAGLVGAIVSLRRENLTAGTEARTEAPAG